MKLPYRGSRTSKNKKTRTKENKDVKQDKALVKKMVKKGCIKT